VRVGQVYLVWASDGVIRTVLHAFSGLNDAERFVEKCERVEYNDDGSPRFSACEILGVKLSIEPITVKEGL
jgi:hypothetical protein